ncbi:hypothetical protein [Luteolibacter soli]|uniref:Uncharacterized protein n=1 Tax=Luteolibacter soli TaxID=3135280 RepID=A0ABU9ATF2_9BACT
MKSVISESRWKAFCVRRELPLEQAGFAIATCYYGIGFNTRPGTLLLTSDAIIHHSYSWRDTWYAIFEPSIPVVIPLSDIDFIVERHYGFWRRAHLAHPDACFEVVTSAKESHHLVLQRGGIEFRAALVEASVKFLDDDVA